MMASERSKPKKEPVGAAVRVELIAALDRLGHEEDRSRSQMIEIAIKEFLKNRGRLEGN